MMLWKNRNKKVGLCVMVVTACLVMAAVWAVLATPETALADKPVKPEKPDKPGGGGEVGQEIPVCIAFDDVIDDVINGGIRNDGDVYCDGDLKKKVTAIVGRNFSIFLTPNNSNKSTAGRTLWLDLGVPIGCTDSVKVDVSGIGGAGDDSDGICDDCYDSVPDLPTERFGTTFQTSGYPDNARLEIWGRDLDGLLVGNTVNTNARLYFSVGGENWVLHWGSFKVPGGWTYAPGTAPVSVTRVDLDTWSIENLIGDACLYRDNNPPHRETEYHGQVIVPFSLTAVAMVHEESVWGDEPHGIVPGDTPCE